MVHHPGTEMRRVDSVGVGGFFLITGALAFVGVFAFLAAQFNYPEVLDGSAAEVLPSLLATGGTGRFIWALYGFLPLIWIPAGVGAFQALRHVREGGMRIAMLFAVVSAISMMLGLLRWPSIHWTLAQAYAAGSAADQAVISVVFAGLNSFLGNYLGEFLGELAFSVFFLLSALAMLVPGSGFPRWVGYLGLFTAVAGLLGMFRNVSSLVAPVAAVNNYLLPLWMIIFGVALLRHRHRTTGDATAIPTHIR
jgi:hypothetical protein